MKKPRPPKLVTVAIFTTITVIFWVFFEVYETLIQTPQIDIAPELMEPLDPTLNIQALRQIEGRLYFEEGETANMIISEPQPEDENIIEAEVVEINEDNLDLESSSEDTSEFIEE